VDAGKLSFLPVTYQRIANDSWQNMNTFGAPEEPLFDYLKGLNTEDLKQVYKEFGLREPEYNTGVFTIPGSVFNYDKSDLITWYQSELGKSNLDRVTCFFVSDARVTIIPYLKVPVKGAVKIVFGIANVNNFTNGIFD